MSNTEKPDVATVDGNDVDSRLAFADKAEKLLRAILVALGYENAGALRGADLIAGITAWVTLLITMRREPGGSYASFWARAFLDACKDVPVDDAATLADDMTNQFAKRYPPDLGDVLIDEHGRDTQSDLEALSLELDTQTKLVWQLDSENKALLKANEHHASELAKCRIECEEQTNLANELRTRVNAVDTIIAERDALKAQRDAFRDNMRGALVPLNKPERVEPGQRWMIMFDEVDDDGDAWFDNKYLNGADVLDRGVYLGTDKV